MKLTRKALTLLSVFIILALLLTACGGSDAITPATPSGGQTVESAESTQQHAPEFRPQEEAKASDQQKESKQTASSPASEKAENTEEKTKTNLIKAKVTKAVDGDTVYAELENGKEEKVRFIGVDTPESTTQVEPYGKEAASFTKSKLLGKDVWLELDVQERDNYGRLLAYVWLSPPTKESDNEIRAKMFNAVLLLEGYAQVMTVPPNVKYAEYFKKYQQEAREKSAGLWGLEGKEEKPEFSQKSQLKSVSSQKSQPIRKND